MPAKTRSPLLGYNHNLKYKGRVYHVQTEDSGVRTPHVFTHLFYDGTILATKRTDYADLLDAPDSEKQVRHIMQEQHKDMMKELLRGRHDEAIVRLLGTVGEESVETETGARPSADAGPAASSPPAVEPPPAAVEPSKPAPSRPAPAPIPAPKPTPASSPGMPQATEPRSAPALGSNATVPRLPVSASSGQSSGAAGSAATGGRRPGAGPAAGASSASQGSSVVMVAPVVVVTDIGSSSRRDHRSQTVPRLPTMEAGRPAGTGQGSRASRSRDADFKPEESKSIPPTVFTDGVVEDEESLDEVIRQYLAEDLPDE